MAHLTREDIPFHYALADAFTICDAYHCSLLGPTDPNRYHMWTGWVGNDGNGGGPVIDNAEAGYDWSTYPERLERAGISWKIYQDIGVGLDAAGLLGLDRRSRTSATTATTRCSTSTSTRTRSRAARCTTGRAPAPTSPQGGDAVRHLPRTTCSADKLPQVSWIVAPEAYSEHPNWPANYGAWYVSQVLDALTVEPRGLEQDGALLIYDENDGFFDHMVPPTPPQSRAQGLSTVDDHQRDLRRQRRATPPAPTAWACACR